MREALATAQRAAEVRAAAGDWRAAGWIADEARRQIDASHPDDRVRQRPALRTLLWVFTLFAASGAFGLFGALGPSANTWGVLCVLGAIGCAVLTEIQQGVLRLAEFGTDSATSWLALGFAIGASAWIGDLAGISGEENWIALLAAATLGFAALAGWRWGSPLQLGVAAAAAFLLLTRFPLARWTWIAAGAAALPLLDRAAVTARWAPSHRRGAVAMFTVAAAAVGWALHPMTTWPRAGGPPPAISWIGSALFAVVLLAAGLRTRHRWTLDLGLLAAALLTASGLIEVGARPLWLVLAASGAVLATLALVTRRLLEPERRGLASAALLEDGDRSSLVETAAALATASPRAAEPVPEGFRGGGGAAGGGGASTHWMVIAALLASGFVACSRPAEEPREKPLETVVVPPPPDAGASMAEDPQSKAIGQKFSGVMPGDFPKDFPLGPDWSLLDFGKGGKAGAGARRYVTLQIPTDAASSRARVAGLLANAGWAPSDGDTRWRKTERELRLSFTPAGKMTRVRVEY